MAIVPIVEIIVPLTNLVAKLLEKFRIIVRDGSVTLTTKESASLDERIKKIDQAKNNLIDSLQAIDELKVEAEANKAELSRALVQLSNLDKEKAILQKELEEIRKIALADVNTFRQVAGIPSKSDINRERVIGFVTGVLSSIVASGIIFILAQIGSFLIKKP